jgi:eukaryotic-like serine/threonine-protein kinase
LFYELNPLLPCRAPGMGTAWVADMPALMRSLEQAAGSAGGALLGQHLFAFIGARADRKSEMQVDKLAGAKTADSFRLGELALLRDLQARYHPEPMVALSKWTASRLRQDLEVWHNKPRRLAMQARLESLVQTGLLARLLELTGDEAARALDIAGATRAADEVKAIDAEVAAINTEDRRRFGDAERFGHAITGGIGLSALILMVMSVLLR